MVIAGYQISEPPIAITNAAVIYKAVKSGENTDHPMYYVLKQYIMDDIPDASARQEKENELIRQEKEISLEIHNMPGKIDAVIPIQDIEQEDGKRYAVMAYQHHGLFLSETVRDLQIQDPDKKLFLQLDIIKAILISLGAVHSCVNRDRGTSGYVHLDLHPGNIFLENCDIENGKVGNVKFIDFVSAKPLYGGKIAPDALKDNGVIASTNYAAAEYAEENACAICRSTDLYSVGKIFCWMVMGNNMGSWEEDCLRYNIDTVSSVVESELVASILISFIRCALDSNPEYRFQTAEEMLASVSNMQEFLHSHTRNEYYNVLEYLYDTQISPDEHSLEGMDFELENLWISAHQLEDALKKYIDASKCYYIFSGLWNFLQKQPEVNADKLGSLKFLLLRSGIISCNYTGRSRQAMDLFDELRSSAPGVPVMEYLGLTNHIAVIYADSLEYQTAYDIITKNIASLEVIKAAYQTVATSQGMDVADSSRLYHLAEAYSAMGCYMVLLHRKQDGCGRTPMDYFAMALQEFGEDDAYNCNFTVSHILHYAVEAGDQTLFETYAMKYDYFGTGNESAGHIPLTNTLQHLLEQGSNAAFQLYVFLKGIYNFYAEQVTEEFINRLCDALHDDFLLFKRNHPLELIFRYTALILYKANDGMNRDAEQAFIHAMTFIPEARINLNKPVNIMSCITYQTMYQYNELSGQASENTGLYDDFIEHCRRSGNERFPEIYDCPQKLNTILTFDYV